MIWISLSALLILALLSACGVLDLQVITATPQAQQPGTTQEIQTTATSAASATSSIILTPTTIPSPTSTTIPMASRKAR